MLEIMEGRLKFALTTLKKERARYPAGDDLFAEEIAPPWLDSAIYQLELSLDDIAGYRLAHGGSDATVRRDS